MTDSIDKSLRDLKAEIPDPRLNLSELEKDLLIQRVGYLTTKNITKAKKEYALARIPFLFNSIATCDVVDILANDLCEALERATKKKKPRK